MDEIEVKITKEFVDGLIRSIRIIAGHYGMEVQMAKLAEEAAEYSAAFAKIKVYETMISEGHNADYCLDKRDIAIFDMLKELADVLQVANEVQALMKDDPEFESLLYLLMDAKAKRQLKRIEEEKKYASQKKCRTNA